eukprot:156732-Prymnesium_polylepis.1
MGASTHAPRFRLRSIAPLAEATQCARLPALSDRVGPLVLTVLHMLHRTSSPGSPSSVWCCWLLRWPSTSCTPP